MTAFTKDWSSARYAWPDALAHLERSGGRALEVGTFEGQATIWLAQWLYDGPLSPGHVVTVDPMTFEGQGAEDGPKLRKAWRERLYANTQEYVLADRMTVIRGYSHVVMPLLSDESFDVVYIDGDHEADAVAGDARQAGRLVRLGGTIIFDDYGVESKYPGVRREAERWFATAAQGRFRTIHDGYQLIVRRFA